MPQLQGGSKHIRQAPVTDLQEVPPSTVIEPPSTNSVAGMMQLNVQALTNTIAAAVSKAVNDAMAGQKRHNVNMQSVLPTPPDVEQIVHDKVVTSTGDTGSKKADTPATKAGNQPYQIFTSIAINLGARLSTKLKAKIWANEYIDFGALLSVSLPHEKFALSMASTGGPSSQPHLTLELCNTPKKMTTIHQWLTAFNTFVSIYVEKAAGDAPKLSQGIGFFMTSSSGI